ncbi:MAG: DsbA family protein [Nitrospinae bacterium]|nr:DsbA family protein [Nitrospinota bacterium]
MDTPARKEKVRFYFSFNDPYSFLMAPAVKQLGHDFKIDIEWLPLPGYDAAGMFAPDDAVRRYVRTDALRFARKAGRQLLFDDTPMDSRMAVRATFFAQEQMLGVKCLNLLFALRWVSKKNLASVDDLVDGLKFLEMNEDALREAMTTDRYEPAIDRAERLAREEGVVGVPFLTFRGEGYLGPDRLQYLADTLTADPSLVVHHDAGYAVIKADELAAALERNEPMLLLDLRIPKDFGEGHIPGSNCLAAKVVYRNLHRLDREWRITLVDGGGVEASETGFYMAGEGFAHVAVLSGGWPAWKGDVATGLAGWQDKLKPLT